MDVGGRLQHIGDELDLLLSTAFDPADVAAAAELIRSMEEVGRRVDAARVEVLAAVDRSRVYREDGHGSAKVMVRHVGGLSPAEATRRAQSAAVLEDLPALAAAFVSGEVGTCQVVRLGRLHANRRVRKYVADADDVFVEWATTLPFKEFDQVVGQWERLADADGAADRHRRGHEKRDVRLERDLDGNWSLWGQFGSLMGARLNDVLEHFVHLEWQADWAEARVRVGEAATGKDLARTDAQRRADAMDALAEQAAGVLPGVDGAPSFVTNIVIDWQTFEDEVRVLGGHDRRRRDPADSSFRCETLDGHPLDPAQVVFAALRAELRRVVVGADGVVTDLGRCRRFTRGAALAARLNHGECLWPGCHVSVSDCQIDHLRPWADGGRTTQHNGGPLCGRHNRFKANHGWHTWRDADGTWHLARPDGTPVEGPTGPGPPTRASPPTVAADATDEYVQPADAR